MGSRETLRIAFAQVFKVAVNVGQALNDITQQFRHLFLYHSAIEASVTISGNMIFYTDARIQRIYRTDFLMQFIGERLFPNRAQTEELVRSFFVCDGFWVGAFWLHLPDIFEGF